MCTGLGDLQLLPTNLWRPILWRRVLSRRSWNWDISGRICCGDPGSKKSRGRTYDPQTEKKTRINWRHFCLVLFCFQLFPCNRGSLQSYFTLLIVYDAVYYEILSTTMVSVLFLCIIFYILRWLIHSFCFVLHHIQQLYACLVCLYLYIQPIVLI